MKNGWYLCWCGEEHTSTIRCSVCCAVTRRVEGTTYICFDCSDKAQRVAGLREALLGEIAKVSRSLNTDWKVGGLS